MRIKLKHIVLVIVLASFGAIIYGFTLGEDQSQIANKFIGFGTVGLFLIAMPLFLIKESKSRKVKDYMLTEENIRKMQGKLPKKTENQ
ncbi:MAG: hypothetical protein KJO53_04810 [Eudoraea sp.]|nr:hypothetical protein [Eudoraea sp.]MBT8293391.1 hypothetical protein [Eudoraea sp.]NNL00674.1 hypothetical protein [Eudoraea sp.]